MNITLKEFSERIKPILIRLFNTNFKERIRLNKKNYITIIKQSNLLKNLIIKRKTIAELYFKVKSLFTRKIFGIGLSRTGTKSLIFALKELGYYSKHYPSMLEFYETIDRYDALADIPISCNFEILDKKYPHSKFILTVRDINSWLESCERHLKITTLSEKWQWSIRKKCYGTIGWDREKYKKTYYTHYDNVLEYFKNRPNDLLILDILEGEGYEKLCPFLNKTVINPNFPHKNIRN